MEDITFFQQHQGLQHLPCNDAPEWIMTDHFAELNLDNQKMGGKVYALTKSIMVNQSYVTCPVHALGGHYLHICKHFSSDPECFLSAYVAKG